MAMSGPRLDGLERIGLAVRSVLSIESLTLTAGWPIAVLGP
jgi:hypothetical protein